MIINKCISCDKKFKTHDKKRKFCSQKHFRSWRKGKTYEEIYGIEKANKIKKLQSKKSIENKQWEKGKQFKKGHTLNNGRKPWNKGLKNKQKAWNKELVMKNYYDEEQYNNFIKGCIKGGVACCLKVASSKSRTKIEIALEDIIKKTKVRYIPQHPLLGITVSDIYLPDHHIAIYADGDYWHNYPHGTIKDHQVDKELKNMHIKVLRFWERDINNNIKEVEKKIREAQRL